jgi:DNA processing protein
LIPGIGQRGAKQLISYCGSPAQIFKTPKAKLLKIPGVGEKISNSIKSSDTFQESEAILKSCEKIGIKVLHFTSKEYPKRLKLIHDSPGIIYVKGKTDLNPKRSIAIVGTRRASEYGKKITKRIVDDLFDIGVTTVSGLAYGIDIHAHRFSLENGIPTIAVLAGGLDRLYPSSHKKYAAEIIENGALISESVPGTKPDAHLFPTRNRIIAGMADVTLVVEAADKGGALITANLADSYHRVVFAVPGKVGSMYSQGTNRLIASQKALIYTGIEDLIYHLGWDMDSKPPKTAPKLSDEEEIIYQLISSTGDSVEIDQISIKSQIPINRVASVLLALEFKNLIKSLPGKKYAIS